jgi:hypothetical protein
LGVVVVGGERGGGDEDEDEEDGDEEDEEDEEDDEDEEERWRAQARLEAKKKVDTLVGLSRREKLRRRVAEEAKLLDAIRRKQGRPKRNIVHEDTLEPTWDVPDRPSSYLQDIDDHADARRSAHAQRHVQRKSPGGDHTDFLFTLRLAEAHGVAPRSGYPASRLGGRGDRA